jgi:two-component system cell cycle response regulator
LVVDDSKVSRTIITRTLDRVLDNASVTSTNSKQQVLAMLAAGEHFDVITTALRLPDSDGLELTRAIRQSSSHQHVPIIVVSGDAASLDKAEMFAAGVTDSFDKSRGYQAFVAFIQTFLLRNVGIVGRVLYVEDSATAAKMGRGLMEQHGMTVTHIRTAEEALERLQQSPYDFDVVVTDHFLAGEMTGKDLVATIRDQLHLTRVEMPTMVLTGDDTEEVQAEVLHAGANDLITKPLPKALFITRLQSLISIKQLHDGLTRQADIAGEGLTRDALTGLRNKRQVLDEATQWLKDPDKSPMWVVHLSLDEFIKVNLSVGHARGDDAVANAAHVMRKFLPEDALLTRLSGVEFFAALPGSSRDHAIEVFSKLRKRISAVRIGGEPVQLSVGLVSADDHPYNELSSLLALTQFASNPSGEDGIRLVD